MRKTLFFISILTEIHAFSKKTIVMFTDKNVCCFR